MEERTQTFKPYLTNLCFSHEEAQDRILPWMWSGMNAQQTFLSNEQCLCVLCPRSVTIVWPLRFLARDCTGRKLLERDQSQTHTTFYSSENSARACTVNRQWKRTNTTVWDLSLVSSYTRSHKTNHVLHIWAEMHWLHVRSRARQARQQWRLTFSVSCCTRFHTRVFWYREMEVWRWCWQRISGDFWRPMSQRLRC